MKVKFWGVRGSIPTPGPNTVIYGGNTTCLEVRTANNELIILDAGTGIHPLAQSLMTQLPITAHIFISHTHWDHIQGLPFFVPIFIPGNQLNIYGCQDPLTGEGIDRALNVQLQYSYFPIREAELKAKIDYHTATPGVPLQIGSATITPILLNHPVLNFGYRIDCDGKSLFFTGDYEPPYNIYSEEDEEYGEYQIIVEQRLSEVTQAMAEVDVLIIDSSYTEEEYKLKRGWGHGTYHSAIELAALAKVKKLCLTHHEPTRTDRQLDDIFVELHKIHNNASCELLLAKEGMQIEL
jgi:phosphoribosyl 1,2-cyclic phosphodiesterase